MGHGIHWQAVLNNVDEDIATVLELGIQGGDVIGRYINPAWCGPLGISHAEFTLIQGAKSGFGSLGLIVRDGSARNYLHTAIPIATGGQEHRVRIINVQESTFGLEARITAELGEAQITFFEPYYAVNSDRYRPDIELEVVLAGIVYRLQVPDPKETVIHPEIGEVHLKGAASLLSMPNSDPGNLPSNGFSLSYVLASSERPGPDDYTFRGPVKNIQAVDFFTRPASRITTTLLRLNDGEADVDIDLYVLDDNIRQGDKPEVVGDVAGVLWLQGFVPISNSEWTIGSKD